MGTMCLGQEYREQGASAELQASGVGFVFCGKIDHRELSSCFVPIGILGNIYRMNSFAPRHFLGAINDTVAVCDPFKISLMSPVLFSEINTR